MAIAPSNVSPAARSFSALVAALAVAWPHAPAPAQRANPASSNVNAPIVLVPHRAVYEFTLGTARSEKSVTSLSGRMVYEFNGSPCEGWSQTMRFVTRTTAATGNSSLSDQRTTSWEDDAATRLRFSSSQYRDQKLIEQTAGTATRGVSETDDIKVSLTHPDKKASGVTGTAMFPIQHSLKMIDAARRGRSTFTADFYDGADGGEKIYVVTAQIGKQLPANFNRTLPRAGQADKLDSVPAWPIQLSYYEPGNQNKDTLPVYEMSFVFFANGITRRLVIDNGEYSMKGELSEFSFVDALPCKK